MNEFHIRICDAQIQTNTLIAAQNKVPNICSIKQQGAGCLSFAQYSNCYYNQQKIALQNKKQGIGYLPLLILASILG